MERIWTLLTAEISEDPGEQTSTYESSTKLINLADEVVRAHTLAIRLESSSSSPGKSTTIDATEETRLRSAVERTLHPSDPVYLLLQKRLMSAISDRLMQPKNTASEVPTIPERMQAGRDRGAGRPGKRSLLTLDLDDMHRSERGEIAESLIIKGFEDAVLFKAVGEALGKIRGCVEWVEKGWGDLIESGGAHVHGRVTGSH